MNKLYQKFYQQKLFTLNEANKIIKNKQVCKNTLNRLIKQKLVKRVRNNIYHIIPLDNPDFEPDEIHVAIKLREDAIICNTTALTLYGITNKDKNVFIYSKNNTKIRINKTTYKITKNKHTFGINRTIYDTKYTNIEIQTTDIERTILDCIKTRTITLEQMIQIIKNPKTKIETAKIIKYLEKYKKPILYNKIGLILDVTKEYTKTMEEELEVIKKRLSKKIFYAKEKEIKLIRPRYRYYKKWNIMIPEQLYNIVTNTQSQNTSQNILINKPTNNPTEIHSQKTEM